MGYLESTTPGLYSGPPILDQNGKPWRETQGFDRRFALPQVVTFPALMNTAYKVYQSGRHDEALRKDPQFAHKMRNDALIMGILQERKLNAAIRKWHLEVQDERDPAQKAVKDGLTTVLKLTPEWHKLLYYLLEAIWYGRYGAQLSFVYRRLRLPYPVGKRVEYRSSAVPTIAAHQPVDGDKINFKWDGTPTIMVSGGAYGQMPGAETVIGTQSRELLLKGGWRQKFIIHKHEVLDAPWHMPEAAGMIHGVGARSTIMWLNWLRHEWLSNIADWCDRVGMGVRVWYYQANSDPSYKAVLKASKEQTSKTNILVPRFQDSRNTESVEFVDTSTSGADLLLRLQQHIEDIIERYLIGQTLSSGTEGSGLGGSGVAGMHADTKSNIAKFDCYNLGDTLSSDLVKPLQYLIYPELADVPVWFRFDVDEPDLTAVMGAVNQFVQMGGTVIEDDVRALIPNLRDPQPGDKTLGGQASQQGQPGMPGDPGTDMGGQPQITDAGNQPTEADFQDIVSDLGA